MAIGPFPASLCAHRDATGEIKEDRDGEKEKQGFLVHAGFKAQPVRGGRGD